MKRPTGMSFRRLRQYRRNFARVYPDAPERMAQQLPHGARVLATQFAKRFGPVLFGVWFVGVSFGWLLRSCTGCP